MYGIARAGLYRGITKLIHLEFQRVAAIIPVNAVTNAVGVSLNDRTGVAANRCALGVCITGSLRKTRLRQHAGDQHRPTVHWQNSPRFYDSIINEDARSLALPADGADIEFPDLAPNSTESSICRE
jgi:hypothetical protein